MKTLSNMLAMLVVAFVIGIACGDVSKEVIDELKRIEESTNKRNEDTAMEMNLEGVEDEDAYYKVMCEEDRCENVPVDEKECDDPEMDGDCFQVKKEDTQPAQEKRLYPIYQQDACCCKTVHRIYRPRYFYENRIRWTVLGNNWVTTGKCDRPNTHCGCQRSITSSITIRPFYTSKCTQRYQSHRFLVYRTSPFQIKYKYVRVPDYCYCARRYWFRPRPITIRPRPVPVNPRYIGIKNPINQKP